MKTIIQTYKPPQSWKIKVPPGLGDFIRGTCHLFEKFDPNLVQLKVDISQTKLSNFIEFDELFSYSGEEEKIVEAEEFFAEDRSLLDTTIKNFLDSKEQYLYLSTNLGNWNRTTLPEPTRKFIKNFYRFNDQVTRPCTEIIQNQSYQVISIRTGDKFLGQTDINTSINSKRLIFDIIERDILPKYSSPIVVMSDCYQLKCELAKRYKFILSPNVPYHGSNGNTLAVAMDLNFLKNSQFNYHINAWQPWWSGFSHYTSIIFKIPSVNFIFPDFMKEEITSSGTLTVSPRSNIGSSLRSKFSKLKSLWS